jgi:hypothetical protein
MWFMCPNFNIGLFTGISVATKLIIKNNGNGKGWNSLSYNRLQKDWANQHADVIQSAALPETVDACEFQDYYSVPKGPIIQSITVLILQYFGSIITNVIYTIFTSVHTSILECLYPSDKPSVVILVLDLVEIIRFYSYKANLIYKTHIPFPVLQLIS